MQGLQPGSSQTARLRACNMTTLLFLARLWHSHQMLHRRQEQQASHPSVTMAELMHAEPEGKICLCLKEQN